MSGFFFPSACCDAVSHVGSVPTPGVRVPAGSLSELPARQGSAVGGPGGAHQPDHAWPGLCQTTGTICGAAHFESVIPTAENTADNACTV